MESTAYLILENGMVFKGKSFGAKKETIGELVFTTSMTGYLETLTDPSYFGQIVIQTFPLIGNYGIIPIDFESKKPFLKAYIVKEWCQVPSNFRCEGDLDTFLKQNEIPGLYDIDTRSLTKIVREYGVMNAKLCYEPQVTEDIIESIKNYKVQNAVKNVSSADMPPKTEKSGMRVVLWDFGTKANIKRDLEKRGCEVITVPHDATCEEIEAFNPDGIMLSNGPGNPAENTNIISEINKLCSKKLPTFGICLGHQLLALANGAKTEKLKYGHRGANQPAKELSTGRVYITSQNHGYAVIGESLKNGARVSFVNANDGTCEGVEYTNMPAFSVQFHPEACAGPHDTAYLFDKFIDLIKGGSINAAE